MGLENNLKIALGITDEEELKKLWILRKILGGMEDVQAMEFLTEKMKGSLTNEEFFETMKRGI